MDVAIDECLKIIYGFFMLAFPDIEEREITEDWEFAILACDGIWDVMSNAVSQLTSGSVVLIFFAKVSCEMCDF